MRRIGELARIASFLIVFSMLLAACGGSTAVNPTATTAAGLTPTAAGTTPTAAAATVALVTDIGGLNDGSFNQLAHEGYEKARTQYGFPDVVIQTQVAMASEYKKNLQQAASQADLVVGVGFLMEGPLDEVAKALPTKKFALVDGCAVPASSTTFACDTLPNVAQLFFKEQEAGCLVGAMAAQMELDGTSKVPHLLGKNTIGAVGGISIPPVNRYIAGYKYCATKVDPSIKVVIGYSSNFSDPTKCSAIASKQISDNMADILFQVAGGCGIGVLTTAAQKNVYGIGVDADQSKDSTGTVRPGIITSALKRVNTAVFTIIDDTEKGTYTSFIATPTKFDLNHDGVGYATPSSDVPADAVTTAMTYSDMIKSGALVPPEAIP